MGKEKIIYLLVFILLFFTNYGLAEKEQAEKDNSAIFSAPSEKCIENFKIDNIDAKTQQEKLSTKEKVALRSSFFCKAMLANDISNCDKLLSDEAGKCRKSFNCWKGFYSELPYAKRVTPTLIRSCFECNSFGGIDQCRKFITAFINKDTSACGSLFEDRLQRSQCEALISLDEKKTTTAIGADMIAFIKAMSDQDSKICDRIKDKTLKLTCQAYLRGDDAICEDDAEIKSIRAKYSCN